MLENFFSFLIHGRNPAVKRLYFHLPGDQCVYFKDDDCIDDIKGKTIVAKSMFISWMKCNKDYQEARCLTYSQIVSKFVYEKKERCWKPRKMGNTIGRLIWVPLSSGELYYLRRMLTHVKGPLIFEDIRIVKNIVYPTFREACLTFGVLSDDTEYVVAIKEAKDWGSGHFLINLFLTFLLSNSVNRLDDLWNKTWEWLSNGILYNERNIVGRLGTIHKLFVIEFQYWYCTITKS